MYVEGIAGSPTSLNPLFASFNEPDHDLTSLIFSGLTRLDGPERWYPTFAESWQIGADGRSYTFQLRADATWHDGVPVTADDAVFTFTLLQNKDLPANPDLVSLWQNVKVSANSHAPSSSRSTSRSPPSSPTPRSAFYLATCWEALRRRIFRAPPSTRGPSARARSSCSRRVSIR